MGRGGKSGGASDGDNEVSTGPRAPLYPDQHGQPGIHILGSRAMGGGGEAGGTVQVLEIGKSVLGPVHPDTLNNMASLSHTWKQQGRESDALAMLEACIQLQNQQLGANCQRTGTWNIQEVSKDQVVQAGKVKVEQAPWLSDHQIQNCNEGVFQESCLILYVQR
jgi:hypothetical protein